MDKWNRGTFSAKTLKRTAEVMAISILPLDLTACINNTKVDTTSMASLGLISELEKGEFLKKVPYQTTAQDA
ncbi:hypothetical protein [Mesobacillus subterraneus]|uniref:Uncharacterized protein n=1 Tax=Mesobacillus subterraneus TaxID=285983 RepID=A0A427TPL7_9BACI|nr:hypothetical protein [Mesobacillus subterraneus]RSD26262.1 hypothetical protein EJA10_15715 [Mesobacillus subterraneus]